MQEMVELAEANGSITRLGEQVLRHAMVGVVDTVPDADDAGDAAAAEPTAD